MDIDQSKENIQPLRGGRNIAQLGIALQAQSDADVQRQLHLQKEEYELAIRNYEGPDPLDPWFSYIQWVEQSFPKHGHEGHIDKLVKDCIQTFEMDTRYYQDRRFVKLWIKYIDSLANPLELYQMLFNKGIGTECSEFYRAWACYCEELNDYKKANQVYMFGLQAKAQPLDELQQAHMNFQLFFAQRMLHDDSPTKRKAASALAETRQALTSLKTFKRRNIAAAPVQRVGDNVKSIVPGVVRQQPVNNENYGARSNVMVNVYEETPSTSQQHFLPALSATPVPGSIVQAHNLENEKEVGIWTNGKVTKQPVVVPHQPLPFTLYEDENPILPPDHRGYCCDDLAFTCPLSVPDPPDDTKIPYYNKAMVYVDNTEYSLEEIRSRKYITQKTLKQEQIEKKPNEPCQNISQQIKTEEKPSCSALDTLANCALSTDNDYENLMPLNIPALQNVTKVHNIHSPGEPKILVNLDSKELSELSNIVKGNVNQISNYNDENNFGRVNLADEFSKSLMGNLHSDSVTVNTKEARWELRNLFTDNTEPSLVQPIVQNVPMPNFEIHEDKSMTIALNTKNRGVSELMNAVPDDKENALSSPTPTSESPDNQLAKTFQEEPGCTQAFNFNIKVSSTPNVAQFKKPVTFLEPSRIHSIGKFQLDDEVAKPDEIQECNVMDQPTQIKPNGLSAILETTETNSKSGSSGSSGQSTRHTSGYTTHAHYTPGSNAHFDSTPYNDPKRNSVPAQSRVPNGLYARAYNTPKAAPTPEVKTQPQHNAYAQNEQQYQKPNYNGFTAQRTLQMHGYQQGYSYTTPQGFQSPPAAYQQHPSMQSLHQMQTPHQIASPHSIQTPHHGQQTPQHLPQSPHNTQPTSHHPQHIPHQVSHQVHQSQHHSPITHPMQSPNHMQSPHHVQSPPHVQQGFQSPTYTHGYQNQALAMPNATTPYPSRNDYMQDYNNSVNRNQYQNSINNYQTPEREQGYPNQYQRQPDYTGQHQLNGYQQNYHHQEQYQGPNAYANQAYHNQSYNSQHNIYQQKQNNDNLAYNAYQQSATNHLQFQGYQSPTVDHSYHQASPAAQPPAQPMQTSPVYHAPEPYRTNQATPKTPKQAKERKPRKPKAQADPNAVLNTSQNGANSIQQAAQTSLKSPTSLLRSVRHEQLNSKANPTTEFSNQFLNFISSRNEPKDNANTPKFTSSPNISQKLHKNLYVSSPEQAQIPPSTVSNDGETITAQTPSTPLQAAKLPVAEKEKPPKDVSKRQLDFELRPELQSEDSRDSVSKDSRISMTSRKTMHSDVYMTDMDSENSMESTAMKACSISMVETHEIARPADIDFPEEIDPFSRRIISQLLDYVQFPNKTHSQGYFEVKSVPKVQNNTLISVGNHRYSVEKQLGKGNYGSVFCCYDVISGKSVAVKYQKPARPWEFYICQELKARITDPYMLPGYMDITQAFIGENASIFVSELSKYGSLLDVANKVRVATSKCICEPIVLLFTAEMLSIVHHLHKSHIIHADIKPDNFLLMEIPNAEWKTPSLQLIDMGCSIDMSLFPETTTFREMITTEGFTCTEMKEGKPWTYQTDLYCLAGTIHVILFGSYMKVAHKLGQWSIDRKLPRYAKVSLWDKVFGTLLNVPDCDAQPDLMELKREVDLVIRELENLPSELRKLANTLKSR